jgi:hypothetical protein
MCKDLDSSDLVSSQPDDPEAPDPTATLGVVQALISIFLDDGDRLRSIKSGQTRITFVLRPPLYYVAVSAWGEPESVVRKPLSNFGEWADGRASEDTRPP